MAPRQQANFGYLLVGLLIILIAGPVFHDFNDQPLTVVSQVAFSVTLILGIWSLMESRKRFTIGMALVVVQISCTIINLLRPSPVIETVSLIAALAFCVLSLVIALRHVLFDDHIDLNRLIGAVCAYLLLGITISILNMLIYRYIPNSFSGLSGIDTRTNTIEMIYYSFVTMTTLGFGDITPDGSLARVLAYLAAIAGQFYIAILVGTLVGMYLSQKNHGEDEPPG